MNSAMTKAGVDCGTDRFGLFKNRVRGSPVGRTLPFILVLICLFGSSNAFSDQPASWKVSGWSFFKNRALKQQIGLIFHEEKDFFEASDIEDAALVLISSMESAGYLASSASATILSENGSVETVEWQNAFDVFLPRDTRAKEVRFDLNLGPRFYYDALDISNSEVLSNEEIGSFFYSESLLFESEKSRVFTPGLMKSGRGNLEAHLNGMGYQEAIVEANLDTMKRESGAANVSVNVREGPLFLVKDIAIELAEGSVLVEVGFSEFEGQAYSRFLLQDVVRLVRNMYFDNGYAEVAIDPDLEVTGRGKSKRSVRIKLKVDSGPQIRIGSIEFLGIERTKASLLRSRTELEEEGLFNPRLLDETRLNFSRLGVFDKVDYAFEDESAGYRAIDFGLKERSRWTLDAFLGWGSYEQLRGGIQAERLNLFGLAHRLRFKSLISFKSALGEARYMMPDIFSTRATVSSKLFALQREEESFDRREFGIDVGVSRKLEFWDLDFDTVYTFQSLEARDSKLDDDLSKDNSSRVGSLEIRLGRDRRDSPLNPRDGYRFFGRFEWAAEALGGEVDYQRAEMGYSQHGEISRGLYWHLGLTHGVIGSLSESESQVPTNKLFFPGGENSVRGYQRGEAAPLDSNGNSAGARSYLLANLEVEQYLTDSLSVVLFYDAVGLAAKIEEYPFDDTLSSLGLGLRLKTFMGPIRFEYGHNLQQRSSDPKGTFHFSIGYPF